MCLRPIDLRSLFINLNRFTSDSILISIRVAHRVRAHTHTLILSHIHNKGAIAGLALLCTLESNHLLVHKVSALRYIEQNQQCFVGGELLKRSSKN